MASFEVLVARDPCKKGSAVVRQGRLIAVVGAFVIAVLVVGCGAVGRGNDDGRGDKLGALTIKEETTAPEGERSKAQSAQKPAQKPVGLEAKVVSPLGQANVPRGFGEGSLWATGFDPSPTSDDYGASAGRGPKKTLLKRVDPQAGEVVATIPLKGLNVSFTQVAFGAGSVWVSSGYYDMGPAPKRGPGDVVFRIDPRTNRVVDRIPVGSPSGLAFGHDSVWVTSAGYGTVSRIDPKPTRWWRR
jgi:hypothetical protein